MTLRKERGVVVAEPDLTLGILPHQSFERKIDAHRLHAFHEWRATLRIAKDKHLGGPKGLTHLCSTGGVVDTRKDIEAALFGVFFEPVHRFLGRERALDRDEAISSKGSRCERQQQGKDERQ